MSELASSELSETTSLSQIEVVLAQQVNAGKDPNEEPVRKARMSNLVVYCDQPQVFETIQNTVPDIVAQHPARVILVVKEPGEVDGQVQGAVNVWCHLGGGPRQRICSEQITLRARSRGVDHLPYAVRGLLLGDLPTNLWWATNTPPPFAGNLLQDLADRAQQIIYDSIGWPEPARGVAATSAWLTGIERSNGNGAWRVASDVNWRRLKYWRRILAQALDPTTAPGALDSITEIAIDHGPHAVIQAWELVSWLASRLGWQIGGGKIQPNVEIAWKVQATHGPLTVKINRLAEGPTAIRRVRIACTIDGARTAINLTDEGKEILRVTLEGQDAAARTVMMPPQPLHDLIARQLTDRERDSVFLESMAVAKVFAQSLLK
ncbi:MAG: glucose-6-phosphate dehydrogenase assembly protein OpcA [Planctomycetes bacterium]|nr:glucose-6-phosphate dehydrogenase assembly protein OpcA [Planctomycetota bacterium]